MAREHVCVCVRERVRACVCDHSTDVYCRYREACKLTPPPPPLFFQFKYNHCSWSRLPSSSRMSSVIYPNPNPTPPLPPTIHPHPNPKPPNKIDFILPLFLYVSFWAIFASKTIIEFRIHSIITPIPVSKYMSYKIMHRERRIETSSLSK